MLKNTPPGLLKPIDNVTAVMVVFVLPMHRGSGQAAKRHLVGNVSGPDGCPECRDRLLRHNARRRKTKPAGEGSNSSTLLQFQAPTPAPAIPAAVEGSLPAAGTQDMPPLKKPHITPVSPCPLHCYLPCIVTLHLSTSSAPEERLADASCLRLHAMRTHVVAVKSKTSMRDGVWWVQWFLCIVISKHLLKFSILSNFLQVVGPCHLKKGILSSGHIRKRSQVPLPFAAVLLQAVPGKQVLGTGPWRVEPGVVSSFMIISARDRSVLDREQRLVYGGEGPRPGRHGGLQPLLGVSQPVRLNWIPVPRPDPMMEAGLTAVLEPEDKAGKDSFSPYSVLSPPTETSGSTIFDDGLLDTALSLNDIGELGSNNMIFNIATSQPDLLPQKVEVWARRSANLFQCRAVGT